MRLAGRGYRFGLRRLIGGTFGGSEILGSGYHSEHSQCRSTIDFCSSDRR